MLAVCRSISRFDDEHDEGKKGFNAPKVGHGERACEKAKEQVKLTAAGKARCPPLALLSMARKSADDCDGRTLSAASSDAPVRLTA